MYEFLNEILECTEFVLRSVTPNLNETVESWDQCSKVYCGLVEKIIVTWRAPLDQDFLEEFSEIRLKLAKKLEWIANDQLSILRSLAERMFQINECLKIKLDRINNKLENISFEEHIELKGVIHEHVMWIEDCWTSLHCFYMQLDFSLVSLQVMDEESSCNLVNAIKQGENDKSTIGKSHTYMQSCLSLIKYVDNKNKIKITM